MMQRTPPLSLDFIRRVLFYYSPISNIVEYVKDMLPNIQHLIPFNEAITNEQLAELFAQQYSLDTERNLLEYSILCHVQFTIVRSRSGKLNLNFLENINDATQQNEISAPTALL